MKNKLEFTMEGGKGDKEITIYGKNLRILVDYDDVNHPKVDKDVKKMLDILNKHWNEK